MAIVNKLQIDAELIAALPALQMVAVAATGSNNIDVDACA
jgi:glycerate dehydrogenase